MLNWHGEWRRFDMMRFCISFLCVFSKATCSLITRTFAWHSGGTLYANIYFNANVLGAETVERIWSHYITLMGHIADRRDLNARITYLPVLPASERYGTGRKIVSAYSLYSSVAIEEKDVRYFAARVYGSVCVI
jgi:hypothetical protein